MEIFAAVLGSSVVAAIITSIVTMLQNRKNNAINHITEERKLWREKIREIALDIEKSEYGGKNGKDINGYLVQLQMRINTYGMLQKSDYYREGHIWDTINRLKNADSEKVFEQEKEILLEYLSLMLKEDWEYSKREVKGFYRNILFIFMFIVLLIVSTTYCFIILKINNIWKYILVQIINLGIWIFIKILIYDIFLEKFKSRKLLKLRSSRKKEKRYIYIFIVSIVVIISIYLVFGIGFIYCILPNEVFNNTVYCVQEDEVDIYVNGIEEKYIYEFEELMEKYFEKKVVIVESVEEKQEIERNNLLGEEIIMNKEIYDKVIKINIEKQMKIPNFILFIIFILYFCAGIKYIFRYEEISKHIEFEKTIRNIQYKKTDLYIKDVSEAMGILSYVIEMEKLSGEEADELLGLEKRILNNMSIDLRSQCDAINMEVSALEEYEHMNKIKRAVDIIEKAIADLYMLLKIKDDDEKREKLKEIKSDIEKLYTMGNLYKK